MHNFWNSISESFSIVQRIGIVCPTATPLKGIQTFKLTFPKFRRRICNFLLVAYFTSFSKCFSNFKSLNGVTVTSSSKDISKLSWLFTMTFRKYLYRKFTFKSNKISIPITHLMYPYSPWKLGGIRPGNSRWNVYKDSSSEILLP